MNLIYTSKKFTHALMLTFLITLPTAIYASGNSIINLAFNKSATQSSAYPYSTIPIVKRAANSTRRQDSDTFFTQMGNEVSLKGENNLAVTSGYIRIGDSNSQCDFNNEGAIRYNTTTKTIEFCNAITWSSVNEILSCDWACQLGSASSIGGSAHACVLKTDNTVACWGDNTFKQTMVPDRLIAKQIAVGGYQACALKTDNTVECWGDSSIPGSVPSGLIAKQIAVGGNLLACALKTDNTVEYWGKTHMEKVMYQKD